MNCCFFLRTNENVWSAINVNNSYKYNQQFIEIWHVALSIPFATMQFAHYQNILHFYGWTEQRKRKQERNTAEKNILITSRLLAGSEYIFKSSW